VRKQPLLAPCAALIAGIALARIAAFTPAELMAAAAIFACLCLFALGTGRRVLAAATCLLGFVTAGALLLTSRQPGPMPFVDAGPRETVLLEGCVVTPPELDEERLRFTLELEPDARAQVSLYRKPGVEPPPLAYGQRIEIAGRVRTPRNFENPGAFDYAGYLERRQIYWTVSAAFDTRYTVLEEGCGSPFWSLVYGFRSAASRRLERLFPDPFHAALSKALLLGDATAMDEVWKDAFRRTGTYHALVVSGMHLTVLAGFLLLLLRLCALPERWAFAATVTAAWLYAIITGWNVPVVRAAAGLTLFLAGRFWYRPRDLVNLLAAVAMGFLLLDPWQLFEASFQLSFLAVASIGALAIPLIESGSQPWRRALTDLTDAGRDPHLPPRLAQARIEMRLLAETAALATRVPARAILASVGVIGGAVLWAADLALVSATIQTGLALPMVIYFHRLALSGLVANILIAPLMGLLLPACALALAAGSAIAAAPAAALLDLMRGIVEWHAAWEPRLRIPDPPGWLALLAAASVLGLALAVRLERRWRLAALGTAALALALLIAHPFPPQVVAGSLELTAIDVGQGESLLVVSPEGRLLLIDAGGFSSFGRTRRSGIDTGEDIVSPYLWSRSIRRLDAVAMSHPQADHIGGMPAILENFQPAELWVGAGTPTEYWSDLQEAAHRLGVRVVELTRGRQIDFGGAQIAVLAPDGERPLPRNPNNHSLVFEIRHGHHRFLFTGDAERPVEDELVSAGAVGRVDVLKVGHHGSRTSTGEPFLEAVRPGFALISAGYENQYFHPHAAVVKRLAEHRIAVFRTDLFGLSTIRSDGRRLHAETQAWRPRARALAIDF
jgi:competence protein ComEC